MVLILEVADGISEYRPCGIRLQVQRRCVGIESKKLHLKSQWFSGKILET